MPEKRYSWLKLREDFFNSETISWLEEQENGKEYCLFYLKLCLKALNSDGILIRHVGDMLIPYDVPKLAEITRTNQDTTAIALTLLAKAGLVQKLETGELYLTQLSSMLGSETSSAERVRRWRRDSITAPLHCNNDVTVPKHPCNKNVAENVTLDIRDKILDKDKDKDIKNICTNFELFWKAYPKKSNKAKARQWFEKNKPDDALMQKILSGLEKFKASPEWARDNGQFIPYPTTWLNGRRWEDEDIGGGNNGADRRNSSTGSSLWDDATSSIDDVI